MDGAKAFAQARELLISRRDDYEAAYAEFEWPRPAEFNWAYDWFDRLAEGNDAPALIVANAKGAPDALSFGEVSRGSRQAANFFTRLGVKRGDRVLLMLDNVPPLWESLLGLMRIGAAVVPTTTLMNAEGVAYRVDAAGVSHVVAGADCLEQCAGLTAGITRILVSGSATGWQDYTAAYEASAEFEPIGKTRSDDPFLLYFTSGTTARPKLVVHTHLSYPAGHLSTMYWIGLREGDRHLNISSPGWAKHA